MTLISRYLSPKLVLFFQLMTLTPKACHVDFIRIEKVSMQMFDATGFSLSKFFSNRKNCQNIDADLNYMATTPKTMYVTGFMLNLSLTTR